MQKIKRSWLVIGIILFFMSGTFYLMKNIHTYHNVFLITSIIMVIILSRMPKHVSLKLLYDPYVWFLLSMSMSFLVHNEISILVAAIGMMLMYITCNVFLPETCNKYMVGEDEIHMILILSMIGVFIFSILTKGFTMLRYEGVFRNPNSSGGTATTLFAVSCSYFLCNVASGKQGEKNKIFLTVFSALFSLFIALASTSRTSVISIVVLLTVVIFLLMRKGTTRKKTGNVLIIIAVLLVIGFVLYKFTPMHSLIDSVQNKFILKSENTLDGRGERWDIILSRLRWFGNGEQVGFAAHNTILSLIDQYGIFAGIFWSIFILIGLIRSSIRSWSKEECTMKYLPIFSFAGFAAMGMTEGMMLKTIMLMCVFSCGILDGKYDSIS